MNLDLCTRRGFTPQSHRGMRPWLPLSSLFVCASVAQSTSADPSEEQVASILATSLVLTDSEAITFGLLSFDPDRFFDLDSDEFGSEDSLERRRSVSTFILPGKWEMSSSDRRFKTRIKARLSYLESKQRVIAEQEEGSSEGRAKDRVYGAYAEGGLSYQLTNKWKAVAGLGLHVMQYDNSYRSGGFVSDVVEPATEGLFFDTNATALVGEFQSRLKYSSETWDVPWEFQSTYSYYAGETISTGDELPNVRPETWSWANGVAVHWPLPEVWDLPNQARFHARRIDVGGDVTDTMGTRNYYELGLGWLFNISDGVSWFDNIGVSVSLNIGSAFRGGSLVLLYNEDY